jgi:hypothetical protein
MIPDNIIAHAQDMLASGLSHRFIASRLGISRGTVQQIETGRRKANMDNRRNEYKRKQMVQEGRSYADIEREARALLVNNGRESRNAL